MKRLVFFVFMFFTASTMIIQPVRADNGGAAVAFTADASGDYKLDFECASVASQLYFVWDEAPGGWTLTAIDGGGAETSYACGENGFLHEYIKLDSPAAKFRFEFDGQSGISGNVYAFGEGAPPDWVERWNPPFDKADLLVFTARHGDEYLYFGGALPYYADNGKNIQAVFAIDGAEDETDLHGRLSGLYQAGVRNYPVMARFEAEDGYDEDALISFCIEQIRRFKPDVALGQDASAGYGDAFRSLVGGTFAVAVDISGEAEEYPQSAEKYGAWDAPKAYLHGFADSVIFMDWDAPLKKSGGGTAAEAALEAFRSQFPESPSVSAQDFISRNNSDRFGLYRSAVGPDLIGGDFFENTGHAVAPASVPRKPDADVVSLPESANPAPGEDAPAEQTAQWPGSPGIIPIIGGAAILCLLLAIILSSKREA